MKKTFYYIIQLLFAIASITIAFVILANIIIILTSCNYPNKKEYHHNSCYIASVCMYYNKKNNDKSVCTPYIQACVDDIITKRKMTIIEYCNSNQRPTFLSEKECLYYLQK